LQAYCLGCGYALIEYNLAKIAIFLFVKILLPG
jgi:hypothetical protein